MPPWDPLKTEKEDKNMDSMFNKVFFKIMDSLRNKGIFNFWRKGDPARQAMAAALLLAAGSACIVWFLCAYGIRDGDGLMAAGVTAAYFLVLIPLMLATAIGLSLFLKACARLALKKGMGDSRFPVCRVTVALYRHRRKISGMADVILTLIAVSALISILARIRMATVPLAVAAVLACYAAYATADSAGDGIDNAEG